MMEINYIHIKNGVLYYFDIINKMDAFCYPDLYPDAQIKFEMDKHKLNAKESVKIRIALRKFDDMELLACLLAWLRNNDFMIENIEIVYLYGGRSDRKFSDNQVNYLRDVILLLLESLAEKYNVNFIFHCPHSLLLRPNLLSSMIPELFSIIIKRIDRNAIFIGGDENADHHLHNFMTLVKEDAFFIKNRDASGNIKIRMSKENIYILKELPESTFVIFDDLCDGGATFIEGAKYLKSMGINNELILCVYHGLFSKGFEELSKYFSHIICTNSYQELNEGLVVGKCKIHQIKVI